MRAFGKVFNNLMTVLLLVTAAWALTHQTQVKDLVNQHLFHSPCDSTLSYKIGSIDPRFDISNKQVADDLIQATNIWDKAEGKDLFKFDPTNTKALTVTFIYDRRQALNSSINSQEQDLNQQKNSLDPQVQAFEQKRADFEKQLADLNSQIDYYNSQGGAPPDKYQQLKQQQQALQQESDQINAEAQQLNLSTQDYNQSVKNLKQTINSFNNAITQDPEEGLFDPQANTITINITNSQQELIHTLAHEMGHYLGLGHNQNQNSIMYPYSNTSITPSQNDLADLNKICSERVPNIPISFRLPTN